MRGDPRARAMAAIGHRQFRQLAAIIPKEDWNNPKLLLSWFVTAADFDRRGADTPAFREAHAALHELITVEGLRDRAAALYHDPRIQNLAGDKLAWYLDHPAVAME